MPSDPHIKMAVVELTSQPVTIDQISTVATNAVLQDVTQGRLTFLLLLTFKDLNLRIWQLHEADLPDEVVRAIIEREQPLGIAFVYPMPPPPELEADRCYTIAVEAPGGRIETLIALKGGPGPGGDMWRVQFRHLPDAEHRWLGVPPHAEVDLWFEGIVGAIGPTGEA